MKILFSCLLMIFFYQISYSQQQCNYINFVLLIDKDVPDRSSISDEILLVKDIDDKITDTIKITYNVGTIIFNDVDFKKLSNLSANVKITLHFKYRRFQPVRKEYQYDYDMDIKWLRQGYIVVNVYNYSNKKYRNEFWQKVGYGIELQAGSIGMILPRKSKKN